MSEDLLGAHSITHISLIAQSACPDDLTLHSHIKIWKCKKLEHISFLLQPLVLEFVVHYFTSVTRACIFFVCPHSRRNGMSSCTSL